MYSREELLKQLTERQGYQIDICNKRPHDYVALKHLDEVNRHIQQVTHTHDIDRQKFLVFENEDYRSLGDNHSEVSKTPIFRCCRNCVESLAWWLRDQNSGMMKRKETYYSVGEDDNIREIGKKIIIMAGRSYADSMQDDELRINSEYLD